MNKTATPDFLHLSIDTADLLSYAEDNAIFEPSNHVIDALLRFSRSLEVKNSELLGGKTELVYN